MLELSGHCWPSSARSLRGAADKISALRNTLSDEGGGITDQGLRLKGKQNLVPADQSSIAFSRTTREVLNIAYGNIDGSSGLFFPAGLNGAINK
jgi:hypothetical protein